MPGEAAGHYVLLEATCHWNRLLDQTYPLEEPSQRAGGKKTLSPLQCFSSALYGPSLELRQLQRKKILGAQIKFHRADKRNHVERPLITNDKFLKCNWEMAAVYLGKGTGVTFWLDDFRLLSPQEKMRILTGALLYPAIGQGLTL